MDSPPPLLSSSPPRPTTPINLSETTEMFTSSLKSPSPEVLYSSSRSIIGPGSVSSQSSNETVIMIFGTSPNYLVVTDSDNEVTCNNEVDLTIFHLFKKLPPNLRHKIWKHNLPGPRLVELVYDEDKEAYVTNAPIIANLSVCCDSRIQALKEYPLCFAVFGDNAMVPFNFKKDTLLLGRKLKGTEQYLKKHIVGEDLGKVENLMVDAHLKWGKRTKLDPYRGYGNLGTMSRLIFKSVKEHTVMYSSGVDPLPDWAAERWFPRLETLKYRVNIFDTSRLVAYLKQNWPLDYGRIRLPQGDASYNKHGGVAKGEKYEPEIQIWRVPKVYTLGVTREVMAAFDWSRYSSWAEVLMDRVIEDIFT